MGLFRSLCKVTRKHAWNTFHGDGHGHEEHGEEHHDEDEHEEEEHEEERIFATDSDKIDIKGSFNVNGSLLDAVDYYFRDTDYALTEQHAEEGHHDEDEHEEEGMMIMVMKRVYNVC